jgi:hypothetical protein
MCTYLHTMFLSSFVSSVVRTFPVPLGVIPSRCSSSIMLATVNFDNIANCSGLDYERKENRIESNGLFLAFVAMSSKIATAPSLLVHDHDITNLHFFPGNSL